MPSFSKGASRRHVVSSGTASMGLLLLGGQRVRLLQMRVEGTRQGVLSPDLAGWLLKQGSGSAEREPLPCHGATPLVTRPPRPKRPLRGAASSPPLASSPATSPTTTTVTYRYRRREETVAAEVEEAALRAQGRLALLLRARLWRQAQGRGQAVRSHCRGARAALAGGGLRQDSQRTQRLRCAHGRAQLGPTRADRRR